MRSAISVHCGVTCLYSVECHTCTLRCAIPVQYGVPNLYIMVCHTCTLWSDMPIQCGVPYLYSTDSPTLDCLQHCVSLGTAFSLTQSSSCQVAHKASTRERYCCRFAARFMMMSHVTLHSFISFSTVHLHASFGRPTGCCVCFAEQLFIGHSVGPKYP